jgi:PAS domain S-box-containing protein
MNYDNYTRDELIRELESIKSKKVKMDKKTILSTDLNDINNIMNSDFLNIALTAAPIGIGFIKDRIIGWTNDNLHKITGYSFEELYDQSTRLLYQDEDEFEKVGLVKHPIVKEHGVGHIETVFQKKDGIIIDIILSTAAFDKEDLSKGMIFTIADITESKNSERKLKASEEKFRILFENAPLAYQSLDEQGNIITVNQTWCQLMGYEKKEVLGKNFGDFIDNNYTDVFKENFPKFKKVGYVLGAEFEMKKKTGEDFIAHFDGKIGKSEDGSFKQTHCTFVNVTEKLKFEEALRESEKEKNLILESVNESVTYLDTEYNIIWGNEAQEIRSENELDKSIGKKCYSGWHDRTTPCNGCPVTKTLGTGEKASTVLLTANNKYLSIYSYPVKNDKNELIGVVEVARDISKRMESELKLQKLNFELEGRVEKRTCQLEDANEELKMEIEERKRIEDELILANTAKDKFFQIIAHDLRNPLQALLLSTDILVKNKEDLFRLNLVKKHQQMYDSTRFITNLLENLLDWSKTQQGNMEYDPISMNLNQLVDTKINQFNEMANDYKINLVSEISPLINIKADENMALTVFRNILSNAFKYTPDNGTITIKAKKNHSFVEIEVEDTGIGISPDSIKNLFKIDKATSSIGLRKEKGTGFGLILCKEFVDKHGGFIKIISRPGEGSIFTFSLPADN